MGHRFLGNIFPFHPRCDNYSTYYVRMCNSLTLPLLCRSYPQLRGAVPSVLAANTVMVPNASVLPRRLPDTIPSPPDTQ